MANETATTANETGMPLWEDTLCLLGWPPFASFQRYLRTQAGDRSKTDDEALERLWRRAMDRVRELEAAPECTGSDSTLLPLSDEANAVAAAEARNPVIRKALRLVRHGWWLAEIDSLLVLQRVVHLGAVREIAAALPLDAGDADLARLACGIARPAPAVYVSPASEGTYTICSSARDLRLLDVAAVDPKAVQGYEPPGHPSSLLAVCVGFGGNCVSAVQVDERLVLTNGTHRTYALRERGFTHVPCLVSHLSGRDELDLLFPPDVRQNIETQLRARRPPRFEDYFDEQLRAIVRVPRQIEALRVRIEVERIRLADIH